MAYTKVSDKQALLATITKWFPDNQIYIAEGAIRTGKTEFLVDGFGDWIYAEQRSDETYFTVAQNMTNLKKNVMKPLIGYFKNLGYKVKINSKDNYWSFNSPDHYFTIYGYSANNAASFERIQGGTFRGGFIDEAALMNLEMIETCMGRCVSHLLQWKIFMTSNPEGSESHWFFEAYLKDAFSKGYIRVNFHLLDNPIFDQAYVDRFKKMFSITMYNRKIRGLWIQADGACYEGFPPTYGLPIYDEDGETIFKRILVGIDSGDSDAETGVAVGITKDNKFIIINQLKMKNKKGEKKLSPKIKFRRMREFINDLYEAHMCPLDVICETNPATMYLMLLNDGNFVSDITVSQVKKKLKLDQGVRKTDIKATSSIKERIDITNMMLNAKILYTLKSTFPVIKSFQNAIYDSSEKRLDDNSYDVDSLDAFEYAISDWIPSIFEYIMQLVDIEEEEEEDYESE